MAKAEQSSRWNLQGMTAIVTGGTKGIGDESQLNQCLKVWETKGFNVTGSVCDISSRTDREKLMQTVSSLFEGNLNILTEENLRDNSRWSIGGMTALVTGGSKGLGSVSTSHTSHTILIIQYGIIYLYMVFDCISMFQPE
ncbi:hypothetical protein ARALYDRAFT_901878 [Arabidopsis lyrata subsp. lyrata]|uniref:Uncharacterized protein n=1 Tax=Arabidopsis lyrata subsp. lyrata TaxID=81972 RepID=D7LKN5_ARALL|nr:hypothetical protein ARALYDRAFT_901878 [Arabidopsis lyrata subsp. lyrata]